MGKRANPLLVGSFVLGGLALAVTVIATIGSGKFFRHTQRFVVYFDGSSTASTRVHPSSSAACRSGR